MSEIRMIEQTQFLDEILGKYVYLNTLLNTKARDVLEDISKESSPKEFEKLLEELNEAAQYTLLSILIDKIRKESGQLNLEMSNFSQVESLLTPSLAEREKLQTMGVEDTVYARLTHRFGEPFIQEIRDQFKDELNSFFNFITPQTVA